MHEPINPKTGLLWTREATRSSYRRPHSAPRDRLLDRTPGRDGESCLTMVSTALRPSARRPCGGPGYSLKRQDQRLKVQDPPSPGIALRMAPSILPRPMTSRPPWTTRPFARSESTRATLRFAIPTSSKEAASAHCGQHDVHEVGQGAGADGGHRKVDGHVHRGDEATSGVGGFPRHWLVYSGTGLLAPEIPVTRARTSTQDARRRPLHAYVHARRRTATRLATKWIHVRFGGWDVKSLDPAPGCAVIEAENLNARTRSDGPRTALPTHLGYPG